MKILKGEMKSMKNYLKELQWLKNTMFEMKFTGWASKKKKTIKLKMGYKSIQTKT